MKLGIQNQLIESTALFGVINCYSVLLVWRHDDSFGFYCVRPVGEMVTW